MMIISVKCDYYRKNTVKKEVFQNMFINTIQFIFRLILYVYIMFKMVISINAVDVQYLIMRNTITEINNLL